MSIDINWSLLNTPSSFSSSEAGPSTSTRRADTTDPFSNGYPGASSSSSSFGNIEDLDSTTEGIDFTNDLSESLINLLNEQLKTTKRPSFIGPITITSFNFGDLGPELEIKDIRDVWRVFDLGDEQGDEELLEQEQAELEKQFKKDEELTNSLRGVESKLDNERYEYIAGNNIDQDTYNNNNDDIGVDYNDNYHHHPHLDVRSTIKKKSNNNRHSHSGSQFQSQPHSLSYSRNQPPTYFSRSHSHSQSQSQYPQIPRSISNPHVLSSNIAGSSTSNSGKSFIPFPFDPNSSGLNGIVNHNHNNNQQNDFHGFNGFNQMSASSALFSPGLGRRPASIASLPLNRPSSIVGMGVGLNSSASILSPTHIHTHGNRNRDRSNTRDILDLDEEEGIQIIPLTREHSSFELPISSPPAKPPKNLPQHKETKRDIPSLQIHLNLKHKSNLNLCLLTSLQVNYPSNLFMSLPLKLLVTGFELNSELIIAYSNEKNRLHLTILDQPEEEEEEEDDNLNDQSQHSQHQQNNNNNNNSYYRSSKRNSMLLLDNQKIPIGQRLLPNLQIESEIGHSDAHVLRNVGKVERFIVDVIRKTLVEELVFPNFHTIAL
ncbi:uncharacterized protein L201_002050 [Kwoniella dendrophila CBS 6074]|uniref:Mitochondrial distribution and morphology protein 12 n=1 Tax=Kwoniella dendrophila CBS 6074 TaxID=1295534 RepID=A0AAX4JP83_9TREE